MNIISNHAGCTVLDCLRKWLHHSTESVTHMCILYAAQSFKSRVLARPKRQGAAPCRFVRRPVVFSAPCHFPRALWFLRAFILATLSLKLQKASNWGETWREFHVSRRTSRGHLGFTSQISAWEWGYTHGLKECHFCNCLLGKWCGDLWMLIRYNE